MYKNLRKEMSAKRITQEEVAKALGMTPESVRNWVNKDTEMTTETARRIRENFFPELEYEHLFVFEKSEE